MRASLLYTPVALTLLHGVLFGALGASASVNNAHFDPWPNGIPEVPQSCTDTTNPSNECLTDLKNGSEVQVLGGVWHFAPHVTAEQRNQVQKAGLDAYHLAEEAASGWNASVRSRAAASYYIGPNWEEYADRIQGNFNRAVEWKRKGLTWPTTYIIISTDDPKKLCRMASGTTPGGYAWRYTGYFGIYDYVNLCSIFFTEITLNERLDLILEYEREDQKDRLLNMNYYKSTGQFLLHEMLHTAYIGIPHIRDQKVIRTQQIAYGPTAVHELASTDDHKQGGARFSTVNADSYAMLANAVYWMPLNGGSFPGAPKPNPAGIDIVVDMVAAMEELNGVIVDLGDVGNSSTANIPQLFNSTVQGYSVAATAAYQYEVWKVASAIEAAEPVHKNGGVLECAWTISPPNSPSFYMTSGKAFALVDQFCETIEPGVIFKPNGTPMQALESGGQYPAVVSATWKGGQDCPTLDFNDDSAVDVCKSRLALVINDCDKVQHGDQYWKGGGTFIRDCIAWEIKVASS